MTAPGWHYAQGDPPGTVRYWDGELWQGDFRYQPGAPAQAGYQQPAAGGYYSYPTYPESSQATAALVLGILGFVVCGLCGPVAWHIGNQEIAGIDAGRRDPSNRGNAQAGRIMGMIVTGLMALGILAVIVFVGFAAASA